MSWPTSPARASGRCSSTWWAAATAAARADASTLAGERDEALGPAVLAAQPHEAMGEDATAQVLPKLLLHELGHAAVVAPGGHLGEKGFEVRADHVAQDVVGWVAPG